MKQTALPLKKFLALFPTSASAAAYVAGLRWGDAVRCPRCDSWRISPRKNRGEWYVCGGCRKEFNVRTDSVFAGTKYGMDIWMLAIYMLLTSRKGVSAIQLSIQLGINRKHALNLLHRIRYAMGRNDNKLSGEVQADETFVGGKEKNKHSHKRRKGTQGGSGKEILAAVRGDDGGLRMRVVLRNNKKNLREFLSDNVECGSTVTTDDLSAYASIKDMYTHECVNHSQREYVNESGYTTNSAESVFSVFKRGYIGIYHKMTKKYLQLYANEFAFRLSYGSCDVPIMERIDRVLLRCW